MDIVVNDLAPDIVHQLGHDPRLQLVESPGTDYQYIGLNMRDPILRDRRVRQAIGYAIDRNAIIEYLRRGLATPAASILPPVSWAFDPDVFTFTYDPAKARALLDAAGYRDPDGDGPAPRFNLTLKVSNIEFNRLQSSVIQQNLRAIGIALEVRTYEFATLYADVLKGSFQLFTLQWVGGAVADPDILRRVFHSAQVPPAPPPRPCSPAAHSCSRRSPPASGWCAWTRRVTKRRAHGVRRTLARSSSCTSFCTMVCVI
jgi:peptide/nickel transport system substrate-binding protein